MVVARSPRFGDASPNAAEDGRRWPNEFKRRSAAIGRSVSFERACACVRFQVDASPSPKHARRATRCIPVTRVGDFGRSGLVSRPRAGEGDSTTRESLCSSARTRVSRVMTRFQRDPASDLTVLCSPGVARCYQVNARASRYLPAGRRRNRDDERRRYLARITAARLGAKFAQALLIDTL